MLQAIINGQTSLKGELSRKIDKVEKRLTERLDKIGGQLAYLEDDTPTREEAEDCN